MERQKRIQIYFNGLSSWLIFLFILGVAMVPVGGFILSGIAGFLIWRHFQNVPKDFEIDQLLKEDLTNLADKAKAKFGISDEQRISKPMFIIGLPNGDQVSLSNFKYKVGKDKRLRLSPLDVTIIQLSDNQIFSYVCGLDFLTNKVLNESTNEIFLKDIVSVETKTKSTLFKLNSKENIQANSSQLFQVVTAGGTSISAIFNSPELIAKLKAQSYYSGDVDAAINEIRSAIRTKKLS